MFHKFLVMLFVIVTLSVSADDARHSSDAINFEIPVVSGVEKYTEFLSFPAYLVVALQNNGINASNLGRAVLEDSVTVKMNLLQLKYINKLDSVYSYEAELKWQSAVKEFVFRIPIHVDASELADGLITARFFIPFAAHFPKELVARLRNRIAFFSDSKFQQKLIDYLDEVSTKVDPGLGFAGLREALMLQSFSTRPIMTTAENCALEEPGDAVPLGEQVALIVTIVIWLVMLPIYSIARWFRNRSKNKRL